MKEQWKQRSCGFLQSQTHLPGCWLRPPQPLIGCPSLAGWWGPPRPVALATHPWRQPARQAKKAERPRRTSRTKQRQSRPPLKHTSSNDRQNRWSSSVNVYSHHSSSTWKPQNTQAVQHNSIKLQIKTDFFFFFHVKQRQASINWIYSSEYLQRWTFKSFIKEILHVWVV